MINQHTLKKEISLEGIGLHTGQKAKIVIKPSAEDSGICFRRVDQMDMPVWRVCPDNIQMENMTGRCTVIGNGQSSVQTIEHLTAALFALGVDNALIEIDGPEVPGMDGSALPFAASIHAAGREPQQAARRFITLKAPVMFHKGDASIAIFPSDENRITYVLDYSKFGLSPQTIDFTIDGESSFMNEIAPARTFCLRQEVEHLKQAGLGKGADSSNTLIMDENGPMDNEMRFDDECARHKVLDLIGDLSVLGMPIYGHVFAVRSGHYLNACLVKAVYEQNIKKKFPVDFSGVGQTAGALDIRGIMGALPHRYPFLLVDRIVETDNVRRAVGIKNLTMNEPFFQGHFPEKPIMPGVLMIEAMAQVGGVLLKESELHKDQIGLFMAVDNVKFRRTASPGDQLVMEVEVVRDRSRITSVHGKGRVNGEIVVEADMMFSFADRKVFFG